MLGGVTSDMGKRSEPFKTLPAQVNSNLLLNASGS